MSQKNYYTAVLIDDEKPALEMLEYLLNTHCPYVKITGVFQNPEEGRQHILAENPQLAFVDIKMNNTNGLQFIQTIASRKTKFIFTTAYHEFALDAWKTKAVSYLLKPIDPEDLISAMDKVKSLDWKKSQKKESLLKLGSDSIDHTKIISLEAKGAYSKIRLTDKSEILLSKNLKVLLEMLPEKDFFRIHRSHVINLNYIKEVNNAQRSVTLAGDFIYEISERKLIEFINARNNRTNG